MISSKIRTSLPSYLSSEGNNFNLLRFFFAFIVVLRHIIDLSQSIVLSTLGLILDSYTCVTGFFVISGFLIWKSFSQDHNIRNYVVKRSKRLLPAYVVFVITASILLSLVSELSFESYFTSASLYRYIFFNLIFLNFIQPCLPGVFDNNWQCAVNGALWTIKVEITFYIIVPLLYKYTQKISKKYLLFLTLYVLSVLYKHYLETQGNSLFSILSRQLPGFMSYFVCGISFFYYKEFYTKYKNLLTIMCLFVLCIEVYVGIEVMRPFAYSMIIFFLAYSFPVFNKFGINNDLSYGIYIFHFTIIQLFVHYHVFSIYNNYIVSVIITIVVLLLGLFSWNFIEKPLLRKKYA